MGDLTSLVQDLPAELFNRIYDLTFTASTTSRTIDKDYKPSSCIQVSRATRSRFADSYFNNDDESPFYLPKDVAVAFWSSLEFKHRGMINHVRSQDNDADVKQVPMVGWGGVPGCVDSMGLLKRDCTLLKCFCAINYEITAIEVVWEGKVQWMTFSHLIDLKHSGWRFQAL